MNYLAHLYFSDPNPLAWAGSLMGDFFKGSNFSGMPHPLVRHIRLHRFIDSYTSRDQSFQRSCKRLDPALRLARGIVIDVFYDHFLARHWQNFSESDLAVFSAQVYSALHSHEAYLSPGLKQQLPHMIEHDWLTSYRRPEIIARVLERLEQRLRGKFPLTQAYASLATCSDVLEADFFQFMQAAETLVVDWKNEHPAEDQARSMSDI